MNTLSKDISRKRRLLSLDYWVSWLPFFQVLPNMTSKDRIASIDQFRGYTLFAMIMVNFLGGFQAMPWQFKHHEVQMSFADTVAINFLFAVGLGQSLSFRKYAEKHGIWRARWRAFRRNLILMGIVVLLTRDNLHLQNFWTSLKEYLRYPFWDALTHIACAGVLCIPFMERSVRVRAIMAVVYMVFYQVCYSALGYGKWVMGNGVDGGPVGSIAWTVPLLLGSIVSDWRKELPAKRFMAKILWTGLIVSAIGLVLRIFWPFSQRGMTSSYTVFATGLAVLTYLAFYVLADRGGVKIPVLSPLGKNPLLLFLLQDLLFPLFGKNVPHEAPAMQPVLAFLLIALSYYGIAKILEWRNYCFRV